MRFLNTFAAMRTVASFRRRKTIHRNACADLREAGALAEASEQEAGKAEPAGGESEGDDRGTPLGATAAKQDPEFTGERQTTLRHGDAGRQAQRRLRAALNQRTS